MHTFSIGNTHKQQVHSQKLGLVHAWLSKKRRVSGKEHSRTIHLWKGWWFPLFLQMKKILTNIYTFAHIIQGSSCKASLFTVHGRLSCNVSPISGRREGHLVIAQCVMGFIAPGNQRIWPLSKITWRKNAFRSQLGWAKSTGGKGALWTLSVWPYCGFTMISPSPLKKMCQCFKFSEGKVKIHYG